MASTHLPQSEAEFLQTLHPRNMPCLRARTRALREAGWTLRAIGEPLGAPRSTVRSWENHDDATSSLEVACPASVISKQPPLPSPPGLRPAPFISSSPASTPPLPRSRVRVRALSIDVPADDQARIANLAPLARRVRGGTPVDSPYRDAKRELNALLAHYDERGVPTQRLAELAGVSYRAIRVRLDEAALSRASSTAHAPAV